MKKSNRKGAKAPSSKKGAKVATKTSGGLTPLKVVCARLGIDPKRARVKLRRVWRREEKPGVQFHSKNERWDLTAPQVKEVTAILSN